MEAKAEDNKMDVDEEAVHEVSSEWQLRKLFDKYRGVILDVWAPGCQPCQDIKPKFEAMAKSNTNSKLCFARVNGQDAADIKDKYDITAFPTFIAFLNGKKNATFRGASENRLQDMVGDLENLIP